MDEADRGLYRILALSYIDCTLRKSRFLETFTYNRVILINPFFSRFWAYSTRFLELPISPVELLLPEPEKDIAKIIELINNKLCTCNLDKLIRINNMIDLM